MKVATFTDLHVHNYKQFDKNGSRLENCLKVLDDVFRFCDKNGIRFVLFGGDIVDQQQAVPTIAGNALMKRLDTLFSDYPDIIVIAISGNHDHGSKNVWGSEAVSFLTQLAIAFPQNFILIDNDTYTIDPGHCGVFGIPYYQHPEHFKAALENIVTLKGQFTPKDVNILLIHQTPSGLGNPNIPIDTDVNDSLYSNFDLVLCGHIHKKQEITPKFFLLGNGLHRDLGDEGDDKGFWVFDTTAPADTMTFITRKGRYPEFKRVKGELPEGSENDFIIQEVELSAFTEAQEAEMEHFKASLTSAELLTNYFDQFGGGDKELLKIGLEFIQ